MYIVNPLKKKGRKLSDLTSTHPPISERIRILRNMMHGASYLNYQEAFSNIKGKKSTLIPPSGLKETKAIPIRKTSPERAEKRGKKKGMRDLGDLMRAVNKYMFLICACGLKIKVPPDFKKPGIACPRCKREVAVPLAELAAVTTAVGTSSLTPRTYFRKGKGWETFPCSCGRLLQISPGFLAPDITCNGCGRKTVIKS